MEMNILDKQILFDCPPILREFLFYMETIQGRSPKTVSGYYIELRTFFRYLKSVKLLRPSPKAPSSWRKSKSTTSPPSLSARSASATSMIFAFFAQRAQQQHRQPFPQDCCHPRAVQISDHQDQLPGGKPCQKSGTPLPSEKRFPNT